ncbi:YchJ family protein [Raineyella fluvialis]|uniref:UPF0225 protein Rai3103_14495 n=1 Tax=Raineyella fluvialis TaxID=2662261 RepID=A0A5Q2FCK0_9ACTN|nr:YchJ family metal-binding protein [Raineyella fluvialis]QGF24642.1 hypothetical protein Rai3103_14495 [Raineyella fluvialis]
MAGDFCPCQSGRRYADCCGPRHDGTRPAETAEALMRARYSAYARGDMDYVSRTWSPRTRPSDLAPDPDLTWRRLEVFEVSGGGPEDDEAWVTFAAHYRVGGERGVLRERSRFTRVGGVWLYLEGF